MTLGLVRVVEVKVAEAAEGGMVAVVTVLGMAVRERGAAGRPVVAATGREARARSGQ